MSSHDKHAEEMTPEERLKSLQEFAESKKNVEPGDAGILAVNANYAATGYGSTKPYDAPLAPPEDDTVTGTKSKTKKGALARWFEKRRESKESKKEEQKVVR